MAVTLAPERLRLAALPTPLIEAPRLAEQLGIRGKLLIKRDDLTGFAVAGNKARPLEFLAAEARRAGADVLVTGGAPGSNFCQAAAATAARLDIECVLVYAGSRTEHVNARAARHWGATARWTNDPDRASVDQHLDKVADELRNSGHTPYVMPRGGATALGSVGYYLAAQEISEQFEGPALMVIAVGSGGTLAGLLAGRSALQAPWKIVGASVSRTPGQAASGVLKLSRECAELMGARTPEQSDLRIRDARGPGHGLPSADGTRAARLALRSEGLVLDPVYSAKALGALAAIIADEPQTFETTVFWHTGGLLDAVQEWEMT